MADTTPPSLNSLTLPGTVDLSGASPVVTIRVAASDDLSGVNSVLVFFDKALSVDINGSPTVLTGSELTKQTDGSFSTSLTLSSFASAGTYHVSEIEIQDNAGNFNDYQASTLASLNIATAFTLTGGTTDTTLPTLNSLTLPGTVDLSAASPVVTIRVAASDDLSGVNSVVVFLDKALSVDLNGSPTNQQGWYLTKQPDGSFSTSLTLSSFASAGTYHVSDIQIQDNAGNFHDYQASTLASLNIATVFTLTDSFPVAGFSAETIGMTVYQKEYGAAPDAAGLIRVVDFVTLQHEYGKHIGVADPLVYAYEALGMTLASTGPLFQSSFGPGSSGHPNSPAGDAQFVADAYLSVFGHAAGAAQAQHFVDQVNYFEHLYAASGAFGTAENIDLLARGAVYGQMLGIEAEMPPQANLMGVVDLV